MKKITKLLTIIVACAATSVQGQFFEVVPFTGALSNDASKDWTKTWTNWNPKNATYAAVTESTTLNGSATGKLEITTMVKLDSTKVYLLKGMIVVKSGGDLIIPAGTVIRGEADLNATPKNYATIVVERGGLIHINGTMDKPVVFTSNKATGSREREDWGGLVLCGKAKNNQGLDVQVEGFNNVSFDNQLAKYGGTDDNDNSGSISYCRIEFGGLAFEPNKEVNGLTLGSVGKNTKINYVQVSFGGDDGFEWFGGNVNSKYLVSYNTTDDDFDTDFGFGGAVQFAIAKRDSAYFDKSWSAPSGASTSETFESDNDAGGSGKTPYTRAVFSNITCVGPVPIGSTYSAMGTTQKGAFRRGARIRRNSRISIVNSIFMGYRNFLMFDGDSTFNAFGVKDSAFPATSLFRNNIIINTTAAASAGSTNTGLVEVASGNTQLSKFNNWLKSGTNANRVDVVAYTAGTLLTDPQNATAPDFKPVTASPALSGADFTFSRLNEFGTFNNVNRIDAISEFNLFPNPATNQAVISMNSNKMFSANITISDMAGRVIVSMNTMNINTGLNQINLDTKNLVNGLYFVTISSAEGMAGSRLMIQK